MYHPSQNYLDYISNSRIRKPKSKIIVDGKEYTGAKYLKTYPKISLEASDIFGEFPAASCEFEIYDRDGDLKFYRKEVAVYRGLEIEGVTEWVPMGLFRASRNDDIVYNSTASTIKFKGFDRALQFDVAFNSSKHTYPCTYGTFLTVLASNHGYSVDLSAFPGKNISLTAAPSVDKETTERELIADIAALFGCLAFIGRDGKLAIKGQPADSGAQIKRGTYQSFAVGEPQRVTIVRYKKDGYDDITVFDTASIIGKYGTNTVTVENNAFIPQDDKSTKAAAKYLFGLVYCQFDLNSFIDDYLYDLNDKVTVMSKNADPTDVCITSLKTASRIKSGFSSMALPKEATTVKGSMDAKIEKSTTESKSFAALQAEAVNSSLENFVQAAGLYKTEVLQSDGSVKYYFTNTANPAEATYVFEFSSAGFGWAKGSGVWNGGKPALQHTIDASGGAILEALLVRKITADIIQAGTLSSVNGTYGIDLDNARQYSSGSAIKRVLEYDTGFGGKTSLMLPRILWLIKLAIVIWLGARSPSRIHRNRISVLHSRTSSLTVTSPNSINENSTIFKSFTSSYLGRPIPKPSSLRYFLGSICENTS